MDVLGALFGLFCFCIKESFRNRKNPLTGRKVLWYKVSSRNERKRSKIPLQSIQTKVKHIMSSTSLSMSFDEEISYIHQHSIFSDAATDTLRNFLLYDEARSLYPDEFIDEEYNWMELDMQETMNQYQLDCRMNMSDIESALNTIGVYFVPVCDTNTFLISRI